MTEQAPATVPPPEGETPPAPAQAEPPRTIPIERFEQVNGARIDLQRQLQGRNAQVAQLEAELAAIRAQQQQQPVPPAPNGQPAPAPVPAPRRVPTQAEVDQMAAARAVEMDFNRRCNQAADAGRREFADFDAKIAALRTVSPTLGQDGLPMIPPVFLEAALETGQAHKVLHTLASDPSEAERVMALPPLRQAIELQRIADKLAAPAQAPVDVPAAGGAPRPAPAPIPGVVGVGKGVSVQEMALDDKNLPIDEFMRRRNEAAKAKRAGA